MMDKTCNWITLLREECNRTSIQSVAKRLGYSRTAVSLALSSKYPGSTDKLAATVMQRLSRHISCPHLKKTIAPAECQDFHSRPMPSSDPLLFQHWIACGHCEFNPNRGRDSDD